MKRKNNGLIEVFDFERSTLIISCFNRIKEKEWGKNHIVRHLVESRNPEKPLEGETPIAIQDLIPLL
jgi:hypothetical protein